MTLLYHYTTAAGLEGIVSTKCLWASDFRFLNDATELRHGLELVRTLFEEYNRAHAGSLVEEAIKYIERCIYKTTLAHPGSFVNTSVMIVSLTAQSDLLSQWRGYNNGKGFAVGFDKSYLENNAKPQGYNLSQVVYDEKTKKETINEKFKEIAGLLSGVEGFDIIRVAEGWWESVVEKIACMKDEAFSEEQEYRLFQSFLSLPENMEIRVGANGLIPYQKYLLLTAPNETSMNSDIIGINNVVVGPGYGTNQEVAAHALFKAHSLYTKISRSRIPYVVV